MVQTQIQTNPPRIHHPMEWDRGLYAGPEYAGIGYAVMIKDMVDLTCLYLVVAVPHVISNYDIMNPLFEIILTATSGYLFALYALKWKRQ